MPDRLAIIAAGGDLPLQISQAQKQQGHDVFLLALDGIASEATCASADAVKQILAVSEIVDLLKAAQCSQCVFIGRLDRPNMSNPPADAGLQDVIQRFAANPGGDDALLRAVLGYFEDQGFQILGADSLMLEFKAPAGCLTVATADDDARDIERGIELLRALSPYDVGQACVISQGQVVAVEGPEGTDAMLARAGDILKARGGQSGVLIKFPKTSQDTRIDLPAIGPLTIANAIAAGLKGLVFQADGALLIDREACIEAANQADFFIEGRSA
jgi:DUF1009 family protein